MMFQSGKPKTTEEGFALLLTLVVVSVVLTIGLTLLDIILKQLVISSTGRDSEIAFHAAYAGAECVQYWRFQNISVIPPDPTSAWLESCIVNSSAFISKEDSNDPTDNVELSEYEINWSSGGTERCTQLDVYVFDAVTPISPSVISEDIRHDIDEFDPGVEEVCPAGRVCTFVLSRGYNRGCANIDTIGTIEREVKLEF